MLVEVGNEVVGEDAEAKLMMLLAVDLMEDIRLGRLAGGGGLVGELTLGLLFDNCEVVAILALSLGCFLFVLLFEK